MEIAEIDNILKGKPLMLFDGVCNFCNSSVQFIIKRDPKANIRFAALQSEIGQAVMHHFKLDPDDLTTVILIEKGKVYTHSDVGLRAVKYFKGLWPAFGIFRIIPRFIRDTIYNWIARNRYKWFGKRESCMMPTPDIKSRFVG